MSRFQYGVLLGLIIFASAGISILGLFPSVRERVSLKILPSSRQILAKVKGDIKGNGQFIVFVKVKTSDGLSVEAFSSDATETSTQYLGRQVLEERRDAYFHLRGSPTNLALLDVDQDGALEVLVPTFDESLVARLRVYKFHTDTGLFEAIKPDQIKL